MKLKKTIFLAAGAAACFTLFSIMIGTARSPGIVMDVLEFGPAEARRIRRAEFPSAERLVKRLGVDRYLRNIKLASGENDSFCHG